MEKPLNKVLVFLRYVLLSIISLGIYPFYFYVIRAEMNNRLLTDILTEIKKNKELEKN